MWGKIKIRSIFFILQLAFFEIILSILRGLYIKKFLQKDVHKFEFCCRFV